MENRIDLPEASIGWLLYKERFFVLFVTRFSSFSAGVLWMSYSTIVNHASIYYNVNVDLINFLPISVLICSILFSIVAMYTLDKQNLKLGLRLGCSLIVFGYLLRIMPEFHSFFYDKRYLFSLFGHCFVGFGLPFVIFTPSKVAEHWFSDSQRLTVTTIVSVSYLSGLLFSDLLNERILSKGFNISEVTIFIGIPSLISLVLCFCLRRSKPRTPPSGISAIICFRPFFPSLVQLIKQDVFIILMVYIGIVIGSFLSTILIVQQLVKVNLKKIVFCGEFAAFYTVGGLLGALLSSLFARKIKNVVLVVKVLVCGHAICSTLQFLVLRYQIPTIDNYYWEILILVVSGCTGFFVYTIIPFGLDLGSNCSFPNCTEAASNGLLLISGQLFGLILTLLMRALAHPVCFVFSNTDKVTKFNSLTINENNLIRRFNQSLYIHDNLLDCPPEEKGFDYSISLMIQTIIIVLAGSFFVSFFDIEYNRMNINRRFNVDRILSIEEVEDSDTLYS